MIDACADKLQRLYEGVYSGGKESFSAFSLTARILAKLTQWSGWWFQSN
jgi:hypothetical protein